MEISEVSIDDEVGSEDPSTPGRVRLSSGD